MLALVLPSLVAQPSIRKERVQFGSGKSTVTLNRTLQRDQIVDYIFAGEGGQPVVVSLQSKSTSTYFSITAPGEDAALFIGSTSGNRFDGPLPKTDDYTIRVYQNRSAARRGQRADYSITFRIVRDGAAATPKSAAGSWPAKYDASGSIKCSAGEAKLDMMFDFRVIRKSGSAEV